MSDVLERIDILKSAGYSMSQVTDPKVWSDGTAATAKTALGNAGYTVNGDVASITEWEGHDSTCVTNVTFSGSDSTVARSVS